VFRTALNIRGSLLGTVFFFFIIFFLFIFFYFFFVRDLAFHAIALAEIDLEFAKAQLVLLMREWYMNPNGALPGKKNNFFFFFFQTNENTKKKISSL
jgi:hypothetical protein